MATMFPEGVEIFTTAGEGLVYRFLQQAARPHNSFLAWYSPDIEDREPDFILYSPDCGLIVLEVKDWLANQIAELTPKSAKLVVGRKQEVRKQPMAQVREYVHALLGLFSRKSVKVINGKAVSPCPISGGAVFPHIRRAEFAELGFGKVIDVQRVLFWDDLCENSPFLRDASGQKLRQWLRDRFPPRFAFSLSEADLDILRACIFPVARIELPREKESRQEEAIRALDADQENLARSLGMESCLITGPAGSGKTLVLAHQAWYLPRVNKKIKKVLITCYNLALPGYIRRLLAKKGAPLGPSGVDVIPFYSLCERILAEKLPHSGEDSEYYELVTRESAETLKGDHPLKGRWDAILVDEGQDFSDAMAQVLLALLPPGGLLMVAEDEKQSLYHKGNAPWENLPGMRRHHLGVQYRNTRAIARLASRVLGAEPPRLAGVEGDPAAIIRSASPLELVRDIADAIAALVRQGTPMNEIAALYVRSNAGLDRPLPQALLEALEERGVLGRWLAHDSESKRNFDVTTDSVVISTIHSVKGLDFANVFFLGSDLLDPAKPRDMALAHVGITRAREKLWFGLCGACPFESLITGEAWPMS